MRLRTVTVSATVLAIAGLSTVAGTVPARADGKPGAAVAELMAKDLPDIKGKEVVVETVEYPPGGASSAHRHDADVFVYVVAGDYRTQISGSAPVTLHAGQVFYEGPNDVHERSENASNTAPVKLLVVMVKDKGRPQTRAAGPSQ